MAFLKKLVNLKHLRIIQLAGSLSFASHMAVFSSHVRKVLGLRSEKEMVRAHTRGVVAFVKDTHALWNSTDRNKIRGAVCKNDSLSSADWNAVIDLTVSMLVNITVERPAAFGDGYSRPEALSQWRAGAFSGWYDSFIHAVNAPIIDGLVWLGGHLKCLSEPNRIIA